jgi:hypothetical protein
MRADRNDDVRDGEAEEAWDGECCDDEHAEWLDKWAPSCPIGNPQRVGQLLAYREREPGRLQLRVSMRPGSDGICEAIVEETEETVRVRVLLCFEDRDEYWDDRGCEYWDCPTHAYLDKPLGGRTVIDVDDEKPLPLYSPQWEIEHNRRVQREQRDAL